MKTLNQEINFEDLKSFALTTEEMIVVRGGDGEVDPDKGSDVPPVTTPPEL